MAIQTQQSGPYAPQTGEPPIYNGLTITTVLFLLIYLHKRGETNMKRKTMLIAAVALIAILVTATVAFAAVTFDPETGEGFVGKGDVQFVYGWNNAALQTKAAGVSFTYEVYEEVEQECLETGAPPKLSKGFRVKSEGILSSIDYEARKNNNGSITGFNLNGLSGNQIINTGWVGPNGETTGNRCPSGSAPNGDPIVVESTSGLMVHHGEGSHSLE